MREKVIGFQLKQIAVLTAILFFSFSCRKRGCMDPNALNTDPNAEIADNSSCSYGEFDKPEMLSNVCDNYILPAYQEFNNKNIALHQEALSFSTNPSLEGLTAVKSSWVAALISWQKVSFLDFGPADYYTLKNQVNIYPIDTNTIQNNISFGTYDLNLASNNDAKGYQALDFLLNLPGTNEENLVDYFINNANATSYLLELTENLMMLSQNVYDEWVNVYCSNFKSNNNSNAQGSPISNVVNGLCSYYETYIRKGKFGLPLGVFNSFTQEEMPHLVECYYYGQSLPFAKAAIEGMSDFINGVHCNSPENRLGLDDYMDFVGATHGSNTLSTAINNQLETIITKIDALNDPLSNEILTNKPSVEDAYTELQKLVPYLKVDMTSALGVLITYQDNDGD